MGVWRQGFHTVDNLRGKEKTTVTSMRAEVMVCVKKSKGKLVNASDSWHAKVNKITKAVQIFTSVDLRNLNPPTVHLTIYHLVWKTSLPFKHSF